jgi:hypothetical protein
MTCCSSGSGTTYPTATGIRFRWIVQVTTKNRYKSSLFRGAGAISKLRKEVPIMVWTISGD